MAPPRRHAMTTSADQYDPDTLAGAVRLVEDKPPSRSPKAKRPRLGPTAFDDHMWRTYETGNYATVEVPVSKIQDIRIRLARSQRWLSSKHEELLRSKLDKSPYTFRTSLIVTDMNGRKLAEGPVKGNLTSPAMAELDPGTRVMLWFHMHLPLFLGPRAHPESYARTYETHHLVPASMPPEPVTE